MSPVHVIVGDDQRAEAMWSSAFTGAVDLYRFPRNVDAFERLTAAEAPIDLVVLTPAQRGPFNLTPEQFIARVLEGPLGASPFLANLHVIVVGQQLQRSHPRVMAVSTLDAAIRLVKFGEIEHAPRPEAPQLPDAREHVGHRSSVDAVAEVLDGMPFSGSVISSIWDAPEPARPESARPSAPVSPAARVATPDASSSSTGEPQHRDIMGGGAARAASQAPAPERQAPVAPPVAAQLFARTAPAGFVVPTGQLASPVVGGGAAPAPIGAPHESIEVATGAQLQPARQYQLEQAGYRGPAVRGGAVHGAGYDGGGQPVPPALANQVELMIYGNMQIGNPHDPLLVWSSAAREQVPNAPGQVASAPQPMTMQPAHPQGMQAQHAQHVVAAAQPIVAQPTPRVVPMEPPAGAYAPAPSQQAAPPADPFLARAEQGGGAVQFG